MFCGFCFDQNFGNCEKTVFLELVRVVFELPKQKPRRIIMTSSNNCYFQTRNVTNVAECPNLVSSRPVRACPGPVQWLRDRIGTFCGIWHMLGLEMTFWDDFFMILHGFCPRSAKHDQTNQKHIKSKF